MRKNFAKALFAAICLSAVGAAVYASAASNNPKLASLKPTPGKITGRAVYMSGKPIGKFSVWATGWTGEVHLGTSGTSPSLGLVEGANGRYNLQPTSEHNRKKNVQARVESVKAYALIKYNNRNYEIAMHPLDGKPNGSHKGAFSGDTRKGVVRDFVLKISGSGRDFQKTIPPRDTSSNQLADPSFGAFFGGIVYISFNYPGSSAPEMQTLKGSKVQLSLSPTGKLLDGSPGKPVNRTMVIERESLIGHSYYFRDIPIGDYTATATLVKPDGAKYPLEFKNERYQWSTSAPVIFEPFPTVGHVHQCRMDIRRS